jgi:hypothetical protein
MCKNIIGITRNKIGCLDIGYTQSKSGLYLDDTGEGRIPLNPAFFGSNDESIKSFLETIIADAYGEVMDMLYLQAKEAYVQNIHATQFKVPKKRDWNSRLKAGNYYYMAIRPFIRRGAYVTIKKITIEDATDFMIIDSEGETVYSGSVANFNEYKMQMDQDYFIVYQSETRPRNYKYKCCGNAPLYTNFFKTGGGIVESLDDLVFKESEYSHGILLECYGSCDPFHYVCNIDFANDGWGRLFARILQNVCRLNLANWIINSNVVTPYLLTNKDDILALIEYYGQQIEKRKIAIPALNHYSDCYSCSTIQKGTIKT